MALIKCRECGTQVSDAAKSCPYCGVESPSTARLVSSGIEEAVHSIVKVLGVIAIVSGLAAVLSGYLGWIVGAPLIAIGAIMYVAPGFSASLLIIWLVWAYMQDEGKFKATNSSTVDNVKPVPNLLGKSDETNPIADLAVLIAQKRPVCETPIQDVKLPNGLIDRYRVFVDSKNQTVIYLNMGARDTLLEVYDLKNKKYGQLLSYKSSLLIRPLQSVNFFETQVSSLFDEKSCNLVEGALQHENFFSCTLHNSVWYADPEGNSGYECKWLNK